MFYVCSGVYILSPQIPQLTFHSMFYGRHLTRHHRLQTVRPHVKSPACVHLSPAVQSACVTIIVIRLSNRFPSVTAAPRRPAPRRAFVRRPLVKARLTVAPHVNIRLSVIHHQLSCSQPAPARERPRRCAASLVEHRVRPL